MSIPKAWRCIPASEVDALELLLSTRGRLPYRSRGARLLNSALWRLSDRIWADADNVIYAGVDMLARALKRLAAQYSDSMNRDEAQAHFDARAVILNLENRLLNEIEREYLPAKASGRSMMGHFKTKRRV